MPHSCQVAMLAHSLAIWSLSLVNWCQVPELSVAPIQLSSHCPATSYISSHDLLWKRKYMSQYHKCSVQVNFIMPAVGWFLSNPAWFVVCRQVEIYTSHCLFIFPRWLVECGGESFINFQSETFFHPGLFSHCLVRGKNSAQLSATKELHQLK